MKRYLGAANRVLAEYRIENALLVGGPRLRAYVAGTRAVCPSDSPLHVRGGAIRVVIRTPFEGCAPTLRLIRGTKSDETRTTRSSEKLPWQ
jgi:hypothetical protein